MPRKFLSFCTCNLNIWHSGECIDGSRNLEAALVEPHGNCWGSLGSSSVDQGLLCFCSRSELGKGDRKFHWSRTKSSLEFNRSIHQRASKGASHFADRSPRSTRNPPRMFPSGIHAERRILRSLASLRNPKRGR